MKQLLRGIMILLMLTPSLLWTKNADTHRPGSSSLEKEKVFFELIRRVGGASYPVIHENSLFLVSVSDRYIYEFSLGAAPEFIERYDIGGKDKVMLLQEDQLVLGFQTNQIRNRFAGVRSFDLNHRTVDDVIDSQLVLGDLSNNILIYDGWIYLWGLEEDKIRITLTDGVRIRTFLLDHTMKEGEELGFHLSWPIENLPVFEIKGEDTRAFLVTPKEMAELPVSEGRIQQSFFDDEKFQKLVDSERYSHFFLQPELLLARVDSTSVEWEDQLTGWIKDDELIEETGDELESIKPTLHRTAMYDLPGLNYADTFEYSSFLYPKNLAVVEGFDTEVQGEAERAQERVIGHYQELLNENRSDMDRYMAEQQLKDFLMTPTSLVLIAIQLLLIPMAIKILEEGGEKSETN